MVITASQGYARPATRNAKSRGPTKFENQKLLFTPPSPNSEAQGPGGPLVCRYGPSLAVLWEAAETPGESINVISHAKSAPNEPEPDHVHEKRILIILRPELAPRPIPPAEASTANPRAIFFLLNRPRTAGKISSSRQGKKARPAPRNTKLATALESAAVSTHEIHDVARGRNPHSLEDAHEKDCRRVQSASTGQTPTHQCKAPPT